MPEEKETPFGILLITAYYIFIATFFFSLSTPSTSSSNYSFFSIFLFTLFGILFILIGWGVLTLKKWAYYSIIIISIFSIFFIFFSAAVLYFLVSFLGFLINIFIQAAVVIYIIPRGDLFGIKFKGNEASENQLNGFYRICPKCTKNIPFDSEFCPYCGNKFINYFQKN